MHRIHTSAAAGFLDLTKITGEPKESWYKISANANAKSADLMILEPIGYWGVSAAEFITDLNALAVDEINLSIMSPGGVAFEGVAIYNALRDHQAVVNVEVNGFAASAASIIAMAGDTITMNRGAQLMIHRASGFAEGDRDVMAEVLQVLDAVDKVMVNTYMARAGVGTFDEWYARLAATTWFSAEEAVAIGLADVAVPFNAEEDDEPEASTELDPQLQAVLDGLIAEAEPATDFVDALAAAPSNNKDQPDVSPLLAQLDQLERSVFDAS